MKTRLLCRLAGLAFILTGAVAGAGADKIIDVAAFGAKADGSDTTPAVRAALAEARSAKATKLVFPPGRYAFWPDRAQESYQFISNNDEGLKRIAFPLVNVKGLEIDGGGASFVFQGPMIPFLIENSSSVTVSNLSFDFVRPFHSEGRVLAIATDSVDLEFSEEFPYAIRNGVLVFTGGRPPAGPETTVKSGEVIYPYGSLLAFDPVKRETAYLAKDRYGVGEGIVARELAPRQVRLTLDGVSAEPGNVLVFGAALRDNPGFVIADSSDVRLTGVSIHHCGGMGVIAQRSANLFLDKVRVTPAPGGKRTVSITADATHFVNCRGKIEMRDCLFENQKDDATNVHGLYAKITRILAPSRFEVRMIHPQQAGVDFVRTGTRLELTHGPSLEPRGYAVAKSVERLNKECTLVETEQPLPEPVGVGDSIADADANTADVLIENCVIRGNRARGVLLGSRGKMVIEGNVFHVPGAAILFEGDARYWFEQAGVRDCTIRGNTFDNCNYGVWGKACIEVGSGIADAFKKTSRYNRNITIEDNLFRVFGPQRILGLYSVDGLVFRHNRIENSTAYPPLPGPAPERLVVTDSDRVQLEPLQEVAAAPGSTAVRP